MAHNILRDLDIPNIKQLDVYLKNDGYEGLKKALKSTQEGFHAIGLNGVHGWKEKGKSRLLPSLEVFGCILTAGLAGRSARLLPGLHLLG